MTRLADPQYFDGGSAEGRVAQFSPNGRWFVIVLRKGNLKNNVNEFSIYLFKTDTVLATPKPDRLLTMKSSSNREAVKDLRWLDNNETFAFIGEEPGRAAQVYTFNIRDRKLVQRTKHATPIRAFATTGNGQRLLYVAEAPPRQIADKEREVVIGGQSLSTILAADSSYKTYDSFWKDQLFSQIRRKPAIQIAIRDPIWVGDSNDLHLSPDGHYCLVPTTVQDTPAWWQDYAPKDENERTALKLLSATKHRKGEGSLSTQLTLVDTSNGTTKVFLDTPMTGHVPIAWAPDSQSVRTRAYLPLDIADTKEKKERAADQYKVELAIPSGNILRKLTDAEWSETNERSPARHQVEISLEEDPNTPPKIYAADRSTGRKVLLLDLNPDFLNLQFGKVETVEWNVTPELKVKGGLYFPPEYKAGQKYPLVIQTHGYDDKRFSMDGFDEWSNAYAARPLAERGFLVLQTYVVGEDFPLATFNDDKRFGTTRLQAGFNFDIAATEAAVDYLNARGLIDLTRVGIAGFSRTVATVAYMLTHPRHKYSAAILTQGFDGGYFQYIAEASAEATWQLNETYGGNAPFGEGLKVWLKESPSFNLDKVWTPIRLVANMGSVVEQWEWFVGLSDQDKPVDMVLLPDADHLLTKPYERQVTQQGMVDWFDFWLNGKEDPDPAKAGQYNRWRELRKLQDVNASSRSN
jgi:dipeptidyl aminopeptidase/acylaminoacyl peptidase